MSGTRCCRACFGACDTAVRGQAPDRSSIGAGPPPAQRGPVCCLPTHGHARGRAARELVRRGALCPLFRCRRRRRRRRRVAWHRPGLLLKDTIKSSDGQRVLDQRVLDQRVSDPRKGIRSVRSASCAWCTPSTDTYTRRCPVAATNLPPTAGSSDDEDQRSGGENHGSDAARWP